MEQLGIPGVYQRMMGLLGARCTPLCPVVMLSYCLANSFTDVSSQTGLQKGRGRV